MPRRTGRHRTWEGLIAAAARKCHTLGAKDSFLDSVTQQLAVKGDMDLLLSAAELVHKKLESFGKGEFARWLRELLADMPLSDSTLINAIAGLDATIVTTNYDDLIQRATTLKGVTWKNEAEVTRTIRGDARQIIHLHGHWNEPESVVLGIRSYEVVRTNDHTQQTLKALGMTRSFVFVGCGDDGLSDPDFGNFLSWLKDTEESAGVEHRHYRLVRRSEDVRQQGRIFPLIYGDDYNELPGFLQRLNPAAATAKKRSAKKASRPKAASKATSTGKIVVPAPAKRTDAVAAYLSRLIAETSQLKLLGFGRSLQIELPIIDAFVPLQAKLVRSMELKATERIIDGLSDMEVDVELYEIFQHARKLGHRGVVLLGEPGAGKTTGARQIAWQLASGKCPPSSLGLPDDIIPVLLRFRSLSREAIAQENGLRMFLTEQTTCKVAKDGQGSPADDLWNGGPLLWILDGLDEVIDPQTRRNVSRWVQEAIGERTEDYFLVTCRFAGYFREGINLGPQFTEFHVRPLSDDQVAVFVERWYAAAYRTLNLSADLAKERADVLLSRLALPDYQAGRMPELRTNPQLLTLLCIVFHDKQQLPDNRAELYAECIMVFLQHWRREVYESELGRQSPGFDAKAAQSVLAQLAWWMHSEQDRTSAPTEKLSTEATAALQSVQPESRLGYEGDAFLNRMKEETGILAADTDGRCGFLHLTFQEYLASDYAVNQRMAAVLADRIQDTWWREVALLSLRHSKLFCEEFFRAMLATGLAERDPDLADRVLNESLYFSAAPFVEVLEQGEPATRVAAVLRMLRNRTAQVPGLESLVKAFADSQDDAVRAAATEILTRMGIKQPIAVSGPKLVFDDETQLTFIRIPAGEFMMGSPKSTRDYERPVHSVRVSRDFLLSKYPVTNAQYAVFLHAAVGDVKHPDYWDDRRFNQPEQPVVGVSWNDAQAFCKWAGCRLTTEAEWEFACRAGTTTEYSFGDDACLLEEYGWYDKNSGNQTQPVGTKQANPWGLHDMHGNVWEWCEDWFGKEYYAKSPTSDPPGPEEGNGRVLRGGSWYIRADYSRSSFRYYFLPGDSNYVIGFRVARTLSPDGL